MKASWLLLLLTGCATWSGPARLAGVAAVSAIGVDCAITHYSLATDSTWREANPFLGPRPAPGKLWALCTVAAVGTLLVADALPRFRFPILATVTLLEIAVTLHNLDVIDLPVWP